MPHVYTYVNTEDGDDYFGVPFHRRTEFNWLDNSLKDAIRRCKVGNLFLMQVVTTLFFRMTSIVVANPIISWYHQMVKDLLVKFACVLPIDYVELTLTKLKEETRLMGSLWQGGGLRSRF